MLVPRADSLNPEPIPLPDIAGSLGIPRTPVLNPPALLTPSDDEHISLFIRVEVPEGRHPSPVLRAQHVPGDIFQRGSERGHKAGDKDHEEWERTSCQLPHPGCQRRHGLHNTSGMMTSPCAGYGGREEAE